MAEKQVRKRPKGRLRPIKGGWAGRFWTVVEGEKIKVQKDLGTTSRAVARARLDRLLEGGTLEEKAKATGETFAEAAERIIKLLESRGSGEAKRRLARLKKWAFPIFGHLPAAKVEAGHIEEAIDVMVAKGRKKATLNHLKIDCSIVFKRLLRDEVVKRNVASLVQLPPNAPEETRPRIVLTDAEIARLLSWPELDPELRLACTLARNCGGLRTSDLLALDWSRVDLVTWLTVEIYRPKTKTLNRHALHPRMADLLRSWWTAHGSPTSGPVLPAQRGARAGERKKTGMSYARRLRKALAGAGITRPLADGQCALQVGRSGPGGETPCDFHSFRRAYVRALRRENTEVRDAMDLAAHKSLQIHMGYDRTDNHTLVTPASACVFGP